MLNNSCKNKLRSYFAIPITGQVDLKLGRIVLSLHLVLKICHLRLLLVQKMQTIYFLSSFTSLTRALRSGTEQGAGTPHLPGCRSSPGLGM